MPIWFPSEPKATYCAVHFAMLTFDPFEYETFPTRVGQYPLVMLFENEILKKYALLYGSVFLQQQQQQQQPLILTPIF